MKVFASLFFLLILSVTISAQTKEECLACHSDNSLTMEKNGKTISLYVTEDALNNSPHKKFTCVSCHTGFDPNNVPHKENIKPVQCATCHAKDVSKHAFHKTVLAQGSDVSNNCKSCHGKHDVVSPKVPGSKFHFTNIVKACGTCHNSEKEKFLKSAHGVAFASNVENAPNCLKCHSVLMPTNGAQKDSATVKLVKVKMCISCHSKQTSSTGTTSNFVMSYEESVHGKALKKGNAKVAICSDCHGSHEMQKGNNPTSTVNKANIPATCGHCHADVVKLYKKSIHGTSFLKGNESAPVCTNCHGEHKILAPKDPNSPVSKLHVSAEVCSPCHSSVKMSEKFGLASGRNESFMDSFHGLAVKAGKTEAANCASCHGFHDVLPSKDSLSRVNKGNLAITCGKCHPGANQNFAQGAVHIVVTNPTDNDLLYFVSNLYIILIIVTIGGMTVHNILDFAKKSKRRLRHRRHGTMYDEEIGYSLYVRMTVGERLQHASLALSFITLVLTGFMLRYPDAWWVIPIRSLSPTVFEIRGVLHRTAAVIMTLVSLYHIYYVLFVPRGKQLIRDLFPRMQDAYDAIGIAKFNLGISSEKPKLDRFSYIEKAEYWALIWGTVVMSVTGVILWFDNTFLGLFGKLWWDVARTVHFYEAWLAALSIIVWHFYFVIFNPDVYPMNLAWFKGTISEEEMADEHPLELERLKEELKKSENENEEK
ncbi:MAG: cytochrome b/b6 domain-containing protein [Bacteroidota bacterium]|nr:cytochrome b/b6 domain-containing protein [Bacteroidota bacterium]